MRIWTLSPQYLDTKGLVAAWREALLAKHVLAGQTTGYRNHPQLTRFKNSPEPLLAIDKYLESVYHESLQRNYKFDPSKFTSRDLTFTIPVTEGQVAYELNHLRRKLAERAPEFLPSLPGSHSEASVHPLFEVVPGGIEAWEIVTINRPIGTRTPRHKSHM